MAILGLYRIRVPGPVAVASLCSQSGARAPLPAHESSEQLYSTSIEHYGPFGECTCLSSMSTFFGSVTSLRRFFLIVFTKSVDGDS